MLETLACLKIDIPLFSTPTCSPGDHLESRLNRGELFAFPKRELRCPVRAQAKAFARQVRPNTMSKGQKIKPCARELKICQRTIYIFLYMCQGTYGGVTCAARQLHRHQTMHWLQVLISIESESVANICYFIKRK